ncbi:undecaprenyl diphosphate synthase [Scopulibacillus darangshiensis]|uniref:Isoprenyl transferase n=1 Tax=Scopulibacillus darangshiensis TaxID=442528 RepID=A0A4R2P645_9BACL|nr:isoprenyl transferase [Scopulibacillus darangshiensis]TCP30302.1 undecaprenyl diphosphate synthase [Scopulibacillus darangshiensis]
MLERFSFKSAKQKENHDEPWTGELNIPKHIAIIMDGNGRWAKKRGLPRIAGHREGMKTVKKIVREADSIGVEVLTLYAFSTENWKRPKDEVAFLMKLPEQFLTTYLTELVEKNVQVRVMGDTTQLPSHTFKAVTEAIERTEDNDGMILNFALNYGSRYEIVSAVRQIADDIQSGQLTADDVCEDIISDYLLTKALPDPDLLIRTSGEIRLSNFMLWQLAYTELWFTDVYWPDFSEQHLRDAIKHFSRRGRRFGGVKG